MAVKTTTFTSGGQGGARLVVEQTAYNTSYATLTAYVQILGSAATKCSAATISFTSVDPSYSWTGGAQTGIGSGWNTVYTKTGILVYYLGNTTRSFTVGASGTYTYDNEGEEPYTTSYNISGTFSLYTLPAPTPTASVSVSAASVTLGNSINITTANGSSGNLTVKIGSTTIQTLGPYGNGTRSWTPALATYAPYIRSGYTGVAVLTWNNATVNVTLVVPDNSNTKPTCTATLEAINEDSGGNAIAAVSGLFVQGKTKAKITLATTTKYNATITTYRIVVDTASNVYTTNPAISSPLPTAGVRTYSCHVGDSRGFNSTTVNGTIPVLRYNAPTITNVSIYRSDSAGVASNDGAYIYYAFTPTISDIDNHNTKSYVVQYKREIDNSWTTADSGTLTSYTAAMSVIGGGSLSSTTVYQARIGITDLYGTVYTSIVTIPTSAVIMDFNTAGTGGGVGMYAQGANMFDIAWSVVPHMGIRAPFSTGESGKIIPVRYLSNGDLGGNVSGNDAFIQAWIKKVCELYPGVTHGIFIGIGVPSSSMIIICDIYSTSAVDSNGLPQYSGGLAFGYQFGNGIIHTFRTSAYVYSSSQIT